MADRGAPEHLFVEDARGVWLLYEDPPGAVHITRGSLSSNGHAEVGAEIPPQLAALLAKEGGGQGRAETSDPSAKGVAGGDAKLAAPTVATGSKSAADPPAPAGSAGLDASSRALHSRASASPLRNAPGLPAAERAERLASAGRLLKQPRVSLAKLWDAYLVEKERGEFESQEKFAARTPILDLDRIYVFDLGYLGFLQDSRYDLDAQEMSVWFDTSDKNVYANELCEERQGPRLINGIAFNRCTLDDLWYRESNVERQSYVGSNAFGVTRKVRKESGDVYELFIDNGPELAAESLLDAEDIDDWGRNRRYRVRFPMSPEAAKKAKPELQILVGVSFHGRGHVSTETDYKTPTVSSPTEHDRTRHQAHARLRVVIIRNRSSGVIYEAVGDARALSGQGVVEAGSGGPASLEP